MNVIKVENIASDNVFVCFNKIGSINLLKINTSGYKCTCYKINKDLKKILQPRKQ